MNPFRQLLLAHGAKAPIGTWVSSASPIVAEAVGSAGFDWGVLDMEHAPVDVMQLLELLQAGRRCRSCGWWACRRRPPG